jgi:hypothetical protein
MAAPRTSLFTRTGTVAAVAMVVLAVLTFWELVLSAVGVLGYAVWKAVKHGDPSYIWSLPLGVAAAAARKVASVPGFVWATVLLVLWLEWRLARLDHSIRSVARGVRILRRALRARPPGRPGGAGDAP